MNKMQDSSHIEPKRRPRWLDVLVRIDDGIARVEGTVLVIALGMMLLLYFLYVLFRNVSASMGESWLSDVPLQIVLLISMVGTSMAARRGRHIAIDIAPRLLPPAALHVARVGVLFAAAMMSALLAYAGWRYLFMIELGGSGTPASIAVTFGDKTAMRIPVWFFVSMAPIGFILAAWHFLVRALRQLHGDLIHDEDDPEEIKALAQQVLGQAAPETSQPAPLDAGSQPRVDNGDESGGER